MCAAGMLQLLWIISRIRVNCCPIKLSPTRCRGVLVTRLFGGESNEVKVLKLTKKDTSLQVKVLIFISTSLLPKSK